MKTNTLLKVAELATYFVIAAIIAGFALWYSVFSIHSTN